MKKIVLILVVLLFITACYSQTNEGVSNTIYIAKELPVKYKIQNYVETNIATWQQKGKYESSSDYKARVNEQTRNAKIKKLTNEALRKIAKAEYNKNKHTIKTEYDADGQVFKIEMEGFEDIYISVPRSEAESFDMNLNKLLFLNAKYSFNDKNLIIAKATIKNPVNGKVYYYDASKPVTFNAVVVENTFKEVDIDIAPMQAQAQSNIITNTKTVKVGSSDVDVNIPVSPQTNKNSFAVIIGNENYRNEIKVKYAINDALTFKKYAIKTLGIPANQVHYVTDATFGTMLDEIDWINNVAKAYNGQAKLIFYYAGHGMPDQASKSAYLLPIDGTSTRSRTAIKTDELYAKLTEYPTQQVTVFLDACFSGGSRDGSLASGRGVKIVPKEDSLKGNLVVFTAVSGAQTAHPYTEKQHGLFTYYLLKELKNTKGNVTYKQLGDYIRTNVNRKSVIFNKEQNPTIKVSSEVKYNWGTWKLK